MYAFVYLLEYAVYIMSDYKLLNLTYGMCEPLALIMIITSIDSEGRTLIATTMKMVFIFTVMVTLNHHFS